MGWSPRLIYRQVYPDMILVTCFEHHSFQVSHIALTLMSLWPRFLHKVLLVQHKLQSYELSNLFVALAPAFLWLCSHRLLTLQSQTFDFAVTDLWRCNHRLSLAILVQTNSWHFFKTHCIWLINPFKNHHCEKLPVPQKNWAGFPLINQPPWHL